MIRLVLLRLLETYFRHRFLYLVPIVFMGVLAGVFVVRSPKMYTSSGILFVQSNSLLSTLVPIGGSDGGSWWSTPAQLTANEVNELLRTEAFVRFAVQRTDLEAKMTEGPEIVDETIEQFRQSVWVSPIGENLIGFGARYEDPKLAQQMASATLDAYTEWKISSDRQETAVAQAFFAEQLKPRQEELKQASDAMEAYLKAHPAPVRGERSEEEQIEINRLQAAFNQAKERVEDTLSKEQEANLALAKAESTVKQNYTVIDAPTLPSKPSSSKKDALKDVAIFLVLGMALSGSGVVGGMLLDRSLRLPIDIRYGLDLPVLALIPHARAVPVSTLATDSVALSQRAVVQQGEHTIKAKDAVTI